MSVKYKRVILINGCPKCGAEITLSKFGYTYECVKCKTMLHLDLLFFSIIPVFFCLSGVFIGLHSWIVAVILDIIVVFIVLRYIRYKEFTENN